MHVVTRETHFERPWAHRLWRAHACSDSLERPAAAELGTLPTRPPGSGSHDAGPRGKCLGGRESPDTERSKQMLIFDGAISGNNTILSI